MSTTSVRYNVPASNQGITITTHLSAPSYSQNTSHSFLKSAKAHDFANGLTTPNLTTWLMLILSLPNPAVGLIIGVYQIYYSHIASQINSLANQYPGVQISTIDAGTFGKSYLVEGWSDITTAVVYLTNTEPASESVTGVYPC